MKEARKVILHYDIIKARLTYYVKCSENAFALLYFESDFKIVSFLFNFEIYI